MENKDFFGQIKDRIIRYEVIPAYSGQWPKSIITLTKQQYDFLDICSIDIVNLELKKMEIQVNEEIPHNAGIIGTTKVNKIGNNTIEIEGSLAVAEKLVFWIIDNVVKCI